MHMCRASAISNNREKIKTRVTPQRTFGISAALLFKEKQGGKANSAVADMGYACVPLKFALDL